MINTNDVLDLNDELPITINVSSELLESVPQAYTRLTSACNKMSAQLNFQTMTANWYHDEDNQLTVTLELITPEAYLHNYSTNKHNAITQFTDDVFVKRTATNQPVYSVYIALTLAEQQLINSHPNLSYTLTQKKFTKVINLLADYLAINKIHT